MRSFDNWIGSLRLMQISKTRETEICPSGVLGVSGGNLRGDGRAVDSLQCVNQAH